MSLSFNKLRLYFCQYAHLFVNVRAAAYWKYVRVVNIGAIRQNKHLQVCQSELQESRKSVLLKGGLKESKGRRDWNANRFNWVKGGAKMNRMRNDKNIDTRVGRVSGYFQISSKLVIHTNEMEHKEDTKSRYSVVGIRRPAMKIDFCCVKRKCKNNLNHTHTHHIADIQPTRSNEASIIFWQLYSWSWRRHRLVNPSRYLRVWEITQNRIAMRMERTDDQMKELHREIKQ